VKAALRERWGDAVFSADASVDRAQLAGRIFGSEPDRRWLEALVHPRVFAVWRERLATAPHGRWVIEVPLLFEQSLENWFDFIGCVACAPEQQLARLEQRGLRRPLAERRITQQLPLAHKIEHSDFVLTNDGSTDFLQKQVDQLIAALGAGA
jgi:dephospho-CoA kinase